MMNLINAIPESVGWTLVGAVNMAAIILFGYLVKTVVRDRITDDEAEEV